MSNQITPHFKLSEFHSKDGQQVPSHLVPNMQHLAEALEVVRSFYDQPMRVHSGYRSLAHNAQVGGAVNSYHLEGMAADVDQPGIPHAELYRIFFFCMVHGLIPLGGLSVYSWGVHYDTRGAMAFW